MDNSQSYPNQTTIAIPVSDLEALLTKVVRKVIKEEIINWSNQQVQSEATLREHPLEQFMEKFGAWEDDRTDEEIIKDIYDSRSVSNSEYSL